MNKIYQRIDWENYPSSATPLNEDNLNKMDYTIDKLDDRIVTHETTKLDTATGNTLVKNVTFNEKTGVFTIEKLNGSKITINTALEKISTNFHFNPTTQKLVLTLIDGTVQEIDLSALITQYEFLESDTITFTIDANGKVTAIVKEGSIEEKHLQPNYLADIKVEVAKAEAGSRDAKNYAENAENSAQRAEELVDTTIQMIENGDFTGPQGPKGEQGPSGVITTINGFFTLSVDEDGNLWASHSDSDTPPNFEYDSETGNLYLVTED